MQYVSEIPSDIKETLTSVLSDSALNFNIEWQEDGSVVFTAESPVGAYRVTVEKNAKSWGQVLREHSLR
ncbi:Uncharacterised protein [Leminorella richardii]|uniref:Uncharacterized protein n=1 Tax=Leminorella richardii TaxID=158841 RepID=A0A2X4XHT8_9GAMM|nr:hypothetical protein [Leminorella richardii]SQI36174.1 Uncharacterised protein [Leminorella richardii]